MSGEGFVRQWGVRIDSDEPIQQWRCGRVEGERHLHTLPQSVLVFFEVVQDGLNDLGGEGFDVDEWIGCLISSAYQPPHPKESVSETYLLSFPLSYSIFRHCFLIFRFHHVRYRLLKVEVQQQQDS